MILYDLHCNYCDAYFEAWQDRNAKGPFKCPKVRQEESLPHDPQTAAYHSHYSPLHPRAGRGKGIGRFRE